MKICYCMATTDLEGGAKSLLDLLKNINKKKNIEPYVVLTKKHKKLENILKDMKINYTIIFHGTDCKTKNKLKQLLKILVNKFSKIKIKHYLKSNKIDIVHNNSVLSLVAMEVAYELKIPYICHVRESIESDLGLEMLNYNKLYFLMNHSFTCVYISKSVQSRYKNYIDQRKEKIIYDGLDTDKYILNKDIEKLEFKKIILVGRIAKGKGQMDAVQAIDLLVNKYKLKYYLTLIGTVGEENYYNQIKKFIYEKKLENYINILSYSEKLEKLRKENDIALICSENEGLGRVTIEAMLSRQLVIGSNAGATKELIKNGINGYLYELHNVEQLANIIRKIDKTKAKKIIEKEFTFAMDTFDNDKQTAKIVKLYEEIKDKCYENQS